MTTFLSKFALPVLLIVFALSGVVVFGAQTAHADTTTSCTQPTVASFTPYIYDGELHSFDYIIDSAVGTPWVVATSLSGIPLETRYTSTWGTSTAARTKMHADVPSWWGLSGTVPVTVHVKTGADVSCEAIQTFTVSLPVKPATTPTVSYTGTGGADPIQDKDEENASTAAPTADDSETMADEGTPDVTVTSMPKLPEIDFGDLRERFPISGRLLALPSITATENTVGVPIDDATDVVEDDDSKDEDASWLVTIPALFTSNDDGACRGLTMSVWLVLALASIALAIVSVMYLWNLFPGNNLWIGATIAVPFVALLFVWFALNECHAYKWFPILVSLVALGTIFFIPVSDSEQSGT